LQKEFNLPNFKLDLRCYKSLFKDDYFVENNLSIKEILEEQFIKNGILWYVPNYFKLSVRKKLNGHNMNYLFSSGS